MEASGVRPRRELDQRYRLNPYFQPSKLRPGGNGPGASAATLGGNDHQDRFTCLKRLLMAPTSIASGFKTPRSHSTLSRNSSCTGSLITPNISTCPQVREEKETFTVSYRGRVVAKLVPAEDIATERARAAVIWTQMDELARETGAHWPPGISALAV